MPVDGAPADEAPCLAKTSDGPVTRVQASTTTRCTCYPCSTAPWPMPPESASCCPACCGCRPVWKRRFFVMRGGYLFKFVSDKRTARPKGTPIPLIDAYIDAAAGDEDGEHAIAEAASEGMDLADHRRTIHIRTIRKEYMLRAETVARRDGLPSFARLL